MKWFKHDSDASSDAKIKKLIIRHGAVGYAVYFHCLELISSDLKETNLTFELEHDSEIIADNLKISGDSTRAGIDIVNEIMRTIVDLGLFHSNNDKIFCIKLAKRLDSSMTSNKKFRALIQKSHDYIMIPSAQSHDAIMQEEKKKEDIIKEDIIKEDNRKVMIPPNAEDFGNDPKPKKSRFTPDLSFIDNDEWKVIYLEWVQNKKAPFKKQIGAHKGYSELLNLSGENIDIARKIIDKSLANNWAGLFALKTNSKTEKKDNFKRGGVNFEI